MTDRIPPYDATAESAVIGSVLLNNSLLSDLRACIAFDDFYQEAHRRIWKAICEVADEPAPVDVITVGSKLLMSAELKQCGGSQYLSSLTDAVAVPSNATIYAHTVRELALRRKLIYTAQEIVASGFGSATTVELLAKSFESISNVINSSDSARPAQRIRESIDAACEAAISEAQPVGLVRTRIPSLDEQYGGIWPEEVTVVAGRPSMGKSLLAIPNISVNVALAAQSTLIFGMEDSKTVMQWRMLSRLAKVPLERIRRRQLSIVEKQRIR